LTFAEKSCEKKLRLIEIFKKEGQRDRRMEGQVERRREEEKERQRDRETERQRDRETVSLLKKLRCLSSL
jgi:hypothetical protein